MNVIKPNMTVPASTMAGTAVAGNGAAPVTDQPIDLAARRKFQIDPRYVAPFLVTCVLLVGQLSAHNFDNFYKTTALAIATSILTEIVLGRLFTGKTPHLASAYVSGISVGILLRCTDSWPFALCAAISIASKYVIRYKGRHLWNPSNLGIVAMLLLAPQRGFHTHDPMGQPALGYGRYLGAWLVHHLSLEAVPHLSDVCPVLHRLRGFAGRAVARCRAVFRPLPV